MGLPSYANDKRACIVAVLIAMGVLAKLAFGLNDVPELRTRLVYIEIALCLVLLSGFSVLWSPRRILVAILLSLSVLGMTVSTVLSDHFYPALWHLTEFLLLGCLSVLLAVFFKQDNGERKNLVTLSVIVAFLITVGAEFYLWLLTEGKETFRWIKFNYFYSYLHIRHFGDMASLVSLLSLYLVTAESNKLKVFGVAALFLSMVALLFTGSRLLIWVVVIAVLFLAAIARDRAILLPLVIAVFVVSTLASNVLAWGNESIGPFRALNLFYEADQGGPGPSLSLEGEKEELPVIKVKDTHRFYIWGETWKRAIGSPWFGEGGNTYKYIQPHLWGQTPHNTFLQFFLNWGLAGCLLFLLSLFPVASALKVIFDPNSGCGSHVFWGMGYLVFFVHGLVASTFYEPVDLLMISIMIGVLISSSEKPVFVSSGASGHPFIRGRLAIIFLCIIFLTNLLAHQVYRVDKRMGKGRDVSEFNRRLYFNMPFTAEKFRKGVHHAIKWYPEQEWGLLSWGEQNVEYKSWYFTALKSNFSARQGDFSHSQQLLEVALKNAGGKKNKAIVTKIVQGR